MGHNESIQLIKDNNCQNAGVYGSPISRKQMQALIAAFKTNNTLLLSFNFTPGEVEDLTLLSELLMTLQSHPTLQKLRMASDSQFTPDNLSHLRALAMAHPILRELSMGESACDDAGLLSLLPSIIANKRLAKFCCTAPSVSGETQMRAFTQLVKESQLQGIFFFPNHHLPH